jgi:integrase
MAVHKRKWKSSSGVQTTWYYVFDGPGSTRENRRQILKSGFASKKEAQDAEAERRLSAQREYNLMKATPAELPGTLSGLLKEFFNEHGEKALAAKTLKRYREMADYLDTELMNMELPKIRPLHLSREWNRLLSSGGRGRKLGKPLSRKTVRNIAGLVSSAYTRGIRWGICEVNPVQASEPPVPKKKEGIALSVEQTEQLIAGASATWGMEVFLELDAATGARRGELLGLQWTDLDGNRLMIGRSLSQVGQDVFLKEPKNKKFRVITIPPSALRKLNAHRKTQDEYRAHFGESYQGNFIFSNPDGSPLKPDTISAAVSLLFRSLKLPKGASLHTLRHTHGSQLLAAGVPLTDVSKRLGHTNPHVTATIYAHAMPGHDDAAADAWERFQKSGKAANDNRPTKRARKAGRYAAR